MDLRNALISVCKILPGSDSNHIRISKRVNINNFMFS
jgi:hypothetical protein